MKKHLKISLLGLVILLTGFNLQAQKKPYFDTQEEVIEAAYNAIDNSMKAEGYLKEKQVEYGWEGTYTFYITLRGKGEVATVSVAESGDNVQMQNQIKNVLKTMRFPFKMPKDRSYKFKYKFKF